jgi:hypothetical protein
LLSPNRLLAILVLTTTTDAGFVSLCFYLIYSIPLLRIRLIRSVISARCSTITTVILPSSINPGTINSKLFPLPVGSTTTSGVYLSSIACTASSCSIDRNPTSCVLKMCYITLQISLSRVVSTRTSLSLGRSTISKLLSPSRLFIVFGLSSTRSSYRLSLASSSTPKNLCHSMLSGRNASIDRTLRCLTISISTA